MLTINFLLFLSFIIFLLALVLPYSEKLKISQVKELQIISGTIEKIYKKHPYKGSPMIDILLNNKNHTYHLTQNDISYLYPSITQLKVGDNIIAKVAPDSLGRDLNWFWELKKDNDLIISSSEMLTYHQSTYKRSLKLSKISIIIGLIILTIGLLFKYTLTKSTDKI